VLGLAAGPDARLPLLGNLIGPEVPAAIVLNLIRDQPPAIPAVERSSPLSVGAALDPLVRRAAVFLVQDNRTRERLPALEQQPVPRITRKEAMRRYVEALGYMGR